MAHPLTGYTIKNSRGYLIGKGKDGSIIMVRKLLTARWFGSYNEARRFIKKYNLSKQLKPSRI